jgi:uncharacterized membrane protein
VPFIYESTNTIRLLTGLLAGAVSAFYAIPVLMNMFVQDSAVRKKTAKNH